jgi:hypothetical protein
MYLRLFVANVLTTMRVDKVITLVCAEIDWDIVNFKENYRCQSTARSVLSVKHVIRLAVNLGLLLFLVALNLLCVSLMSNVRHVDSESENDPINDTDKVMTVFIYYVKIRM